MKMTKTLLALAVSGLISTAVVAQDQQKLEQSINSAKDSNFDYSWVEVDYVDFDNGLDGLRVKGSYELMQPLSLIGSVGMYSEGRVDVTTLSVGASYHLNVGKLFNFAYLERMDGVVHAEIETANIDCNGCDNETGIVAGLELRYQVIPKLEAYLDTSLSTTYDNDFIIGTGVRYAVIDQLQLVAGLTLSDNDELSLGARYNF